MVFQHLIFVCQVVPPGSQLVEKAMKVCIKWVGRMHQTYTEDAAPLSGTM